MNRRGFLKSLSVAAPAIILTPGLLMPVRNLWKSPTLDEIIRDRPDSYIVGADYGSKTDYSAWVKMEYENGVLRIVDWFPKDQNFRVTGCSIDRTLVEA